MRKDIPVPDEILVVLRAIEAAKGRGLLVGGWIRDQLLGNPSKDYDIEVYGLPIVELEALLDGFGEVIAIGRAFGVLRVKGLDIDFSIPRRDSKVGRGHRGFIVDLDPTLDFATAARRRDLTVNSMAYDPLAQEILDAHGGLQDLEERALRATDPATFPEDSLRGLRVAQFFARFEMEPDAELRRLCSALDLSDLPGERLYEEIKKLLLKSRRPSIGFEFLRETGLLTFFPELFAMVDVPQDPEWHPEGPVWDHTMLVLDEAARLKSGDDDADLVLLLGALCHDLGKPETTFEEGGRIRSPEHDEKGVPIAESFLSRLRASNELKEKVGALVRHHLAPSQLIKGGAKARGYRRLSRRLGEAGVDPDMLYRVAKADHFGRTTPDALARTFDYGDAFLERMKELSIAEEVQKDVVLGRHLIARGFKPGVWFGTVLSACREVQDDTGWDDPDRILDRVLKGGVPGGGDQSS